MQYKPSHISHSSVRINPDAFVRDGDRMSLSGFLVRKIQIRDPETVDVCVRNVDRLVCVRWILQTRVRPCRAKVKISIKVLQSMRRTYLHTSF